MAHDPGSSHYHGGGDDDIKLPPSVESPVLVNSSSDSAVPPQADQGGNRAPIQEYDVARVEQVYRYAPPPHLLPAPFFISFMIKDPKLKN